MMKRIKRWLHEIYEEDIKFFGQMRDLHQTYRQFAVGFLFHPDIDLQHMSYPQQILFFWT